MRHDNRLMGMISLFASHAELPLPDYKSVFRGLVNTGMLSEYHPCKAKCNLRHIKCVVILEASDSYQLFCLLFFIANLMAKRFLAKK